VNWTVSQDFVSQLSMKHRMVVSFLFGIHLLVSTGFAQSPYYDVSIVAKQGDVTEEGDTIDEIRQQVSVNDAGQVAFVATVQGESGSQLMVVSEGSTPRNLSRSVDGRQFAFPQINDSGRVLARDFLSAADSSLKLWNSQSPPTFTLVASTAQFQNIFVPSLANDGSVVFSGRQRPPVGDIGNQFPLQLFVNTSGAQTNRPVIDLASADSRPAVSSDGSFVVRSGTTDNGSLTYYQRKGETVWTPHILASTEDGWSSMGSAPGISDSGKVIVYTGSEPQSGSGIWVVVDDPNHRELFGYFRIAGGGAANLGPGITFDSFDDFLDQRIGVNHVEAGRPGLEGDRILITFAGTPVNHASERTMKSALLDNPAIPGVQPLLFDFLPAVWTMEITIGYNLDDLSRTGNLKLSNRTSAIQVILNGHPFRAETSAPMSPTTVGTGLITYPAVELSVRNDLDGVFAVLEFSSDLKIWKEMYSITDDPEFESIFVASKTPRIGFTQLTIRDSALLAFRKRGTYYRLKVTVND
jgi:hypothetical protein